MATRFTAAGLTFHIEVNSIFQIEIITLNLFILNSEQCVGGDGLVQINLQIQPNNNRINILDVLKPADDVLENFQKTKRFEENSSDEIEQKSGYFQQKTDFSKKRIGKESNEDFMGDESSNTISKKTQKPSK